MGFIKKIWTNRLTQNPTRRRLIVTSEANVYDVERDEGAVINSGDAFDEINMNELENRINSGIISATPSELIVTLLASDWVPMTPEEISNTDPDFVVKQNVDVPNLTDADRVDVVRVPVSYTTDGQPTLHPVVLNETCIICTSDTPTVDVVVDLQVQEVVTI